MAATTWRQSNRLLYGDPAVTTMKELRELATGLEDQSDLDKRILALYRKGVHDGVAEATMQVSTMVGTWSVTRLRLTVIAIIEGVMKGLHRG